MKSNLNIVKNETLFFIGYIIMLFSWMFENISYVKELLPFFRIVSYFFAILCIFLNFQKFSIKKFLISIIFAVIVLLSAYVSKSNIIIPLCCYALASRFVNFDKLVKVDLSSKIIFTLIIVFLFIIGLSEKSIFYSYTGEIRYSLGFGNPNTFGYYMFSILADYIYLLKDKIKFRHVFLGILLAIIISTISKSRTATILIFVLLIFTLLINKIKKLLQIKLLKKIMLIIFIIFSCISFVTAKNYNNSNKIYVKLNSVFSGRIVNSHRYLEKYDVTLLGQDIVLNNYNGTTRLYLDNGYLKLLLNNGLLIYTIYIYIYYKLIKKSFDKADYYLFIICLVYMLYGLFENTFFWLTGNVFLLYIFSNSNISFEKEKNNGKNN